MTALDDRIYMVEKAAQNTSAALERALEKLEAHVAEKPEDVRRNAETSDAIARLEDNVAKLDARGTDPLIDKRLDGIEKNLGDLIERLEGNEPDDRARHRGQPEAAAQPRRGDREPPARHGQRIPHGARRYHRAPRRHRGEGHLDRRRRTAADHAGSTTSAGVLAIAAGARSAAFPRYADAGRAAAFRAPGPIRSRRCRASTRRRPSRSAS